MLFGVNFKKLIQSFKFAFCGIKTMLEEEQVFKVMILVSVLVIIAMFYLSLPLTQKAVLFALIILVLMLELVNSTIEKLLDFICPQTDGQVKKIKNMLAGMVLLSCFGAAIIGILIFSPYLLK